MLPAGWKAKESKSHPGTFFYINDYSGETQWEIPTKPAQPKAPESVRCSHLLRKHRGSRRPSSWRCETITQSKEESIRQITEYRNQLVEVLKKEGSQAMQKLFADLASTESDCSSAHKGGKLIFILYDYSC